MEVVPGPMLPVPSWAKANVKLKVLLGTRYPSPSFAWSDVATTVAAELFATSVPVSTRLRGLCGVSVPKK